MFLFPADWSQITLSLNCLWSPSPKKFLKKFPSWVLITQLFFFSFRPHCAPYGILVLQPGIKPASPALGAWSLNHWTIREAPNVAFKYFSFGKSDICLSSLIPLLWHLLRLKCQVYTYPLRCCGPDVGGLFPSLMVSFLTCRTIYTSDWRVSGHNFHETWMLAHSLWSPTQLRGFTCIKESFLGLLFFLLMVGSLTLFSC